MAATTLKRPKLRQTPTSPIWKPFHVCQRNRRRGWSTMLGLAGRAAQACPARTGLTVLKLLLWYVVPCVPANILTCVMTQIAKMFHIHNDPSRPVQLKSSTLRKWVENKADLRSAGEPVKAYRCALTKLSLLLLLLLHPGKPLD